MANYDSVIIYSVKAALLLMFTILIGLKIGEWQDEAVGLSFSNTNTNIHLPSITICPKIPKKDFNKTLRNVVMIDIMDVIPKANYSIQEGFGFDVKEGEIIGNWQHSYTIGFDGEIGPCFLWNGPQISIKRPQLAWMHIEINPEWNNYFRMELHDFGHSTLSWGLNLDTTQEFFELNVYTLVELRYSERKRLSTKRFECEENGSANPYICLQNYFQQKLGCKLPWNVKDTLDDSKECLAIGEFLDLTKQFIRENQTVINELQQSGCWITNCNEKKWTPTKISPFYPNNNKTGFFLSLDPSTKAEIWQEYRLYGITNFIADFGGFLGLFLGYSILSMIERTIHLLSNFKRQR